MGAINQKVRILGVDPGTTVMGYSIIETLGSKIEVVNVGIIHLHKLKDHYSKLNMIYIRLSSIIDELKPNVLAIEAPFYSKNIQSMLKLGRAQGVAITVALSRGLPVHEYSPRTIKQSVTGRGNASKEQVAGMIQQLLHLDEMPAFNDETDALATALCHHYKSGNKISTGKNFRDWSDFVKNNPEKLG